MKKLLGVIFCTLSVLCGCTFSAQEKYTPVIDEVMPACVEITVTGTVEAATLEDFILGRKPGLITQRVLGSGVFISPKGYILTCAHLFNFFKEIKTITVQSPTGDTVFGTLKIVGQGVDLALVKVDFDKVTPYVEIADPRDLRVGQEVIAIGSPLSLSFSVSQGIISALYRDFQSAYNVTQSNTAINPGNSGGPLFNMKGELVGINSFMISPVSEAVFTGLGFSVQCGQIIEFLVDAKRKYPDIRERKWISVFFPVW